MTVIGSQSTEGVSHAAALSDTERAPSKPEELEVYTQVLPYDGRVLRKGEKVYQIFLVPAKRTASYVSHRAT